MTIPLFFQMKRICQIIVLGLIIIPATCAGFSTGNNPTVDKNISLNITSPPEGDTVYIDVVPPQVVIEGEVTVSHNLKALKIKTGSGETDCEIKTQIACEIPVSSGNNKITITAIDDQGNAVTETRNLTVRIGLPPPSEISLSGKILDPSGNPVPGASVLAESVLELDGRPLSVSTTTAADGSYMLRNAVSYGQTITITKAGYATLQQKFVFENTKNEHDFIVSPRSSPALPGFDPLMSIFAITGVFCIVYRKQSGM